MKRRCGQCSACCTGAAIVEIDKPAGVSCPHIVASPQGSCGIYSNRPPPCQDYYCVWRAESESWWRRARKRVANGVEQLDLFSEEERPDKIGIVAIPKLYGTGLIEIQVRELHPGAIQDNAVLLERISKYHPVVLVEGDGSKPSYVIGDEAAVDAVVASRCVEI